jgi:Glycosyltransferase
MKVLLITDDMLPGGVSRHITDLSNELQLKGIDVTVAATTGQYRSRLNNGIHFVPLFLTKDKSSKKNIMGLFSSYIRLRELFRINQFDIIHSHKRYSSYFVEKFLKKRGIIHITSYHSIFDNKIAFSTFGDYTLCCSDAVRQQLIKNNGCRKERSKTIYNGIDPLLIHDENQKKNTYRLLSIPVHKKVISSVGQFIPSKDRETLILSIHKLRKQYDVSQLAVVLQGYGKQESYLKNLVHKLQLTEVITFVDGMFDVEALFNISEFMILNPIHSEGFGIVMLEAASIGKMHIGTRVGGIPEFIEDGVTGKLIDPGNPEQLADAMMYLLNNPNEYQRMGLNAKKKYEKEFTLDKMVDEIIAVYRSMVSE